MGNHRFWILLAATCAVSGRLSCAKDICSTEKKLAYSLAKLKMNLTSLYRGWLAS